MQKKAQMHKETQTVPGCWAHLSFSKVQLSKAISACCRSLLCLALSQFVLVPLLYKIWLEYWRIPKKALGVHLQVKNERQTELPVVSSVTIPVLSYSRQRSSIRRHHKRHQKPSEMAHSLLKLFSAALIHL